MIILGIETSCDETSAAIVKDKREILSNVVLSQISEHTKYGGIVPEIASRRHVENIFEVTETAFKEAKISYNEIDCIAVTYTPGLIGALLVGVNFAKSLAFSLNKPLLAVHHLKGHISSLYLTYRKLTPPFISLVASGAHTHLVEVKDYNRFSVIGRSIDDAAGEAFDKVARALGLGYPGGPIIAKLAQTGNPHAFKLPSPHTENPYDVSFSGLKTSVINTLNSAKMAGTEIDINDMAASFQYTATELLASHLISAAKERNLNAALCGGVAANTVLRNSINEKAKAAGLEAYFADVSLCGDNAAMIAAASFYEYDENSIADITLNAYASHELS